MAVVNLEASLATGSAGPQDEAYFLPADADFRGEINPRNEAAALALLYSKLRDTGASSVECSVAARSHESTAAAASLL